MAEAFPSGGARQEWQVGGVFLQGEGPELPERGGGGDPNRGERVLRERRYVLCHGSAERAQGLESDADDGGFRVV